MLFLAPRRLLPFDLSFFVCVCLSERVNATIAFCLHFALDKFLSLFIFFIDNFPKKTENGIKRDNRRIKFSQRKVQKRSKTLQFFNKKYSNLK